MSDNIVDMSAYRNKIKADEKKEQQSSKPTLDVKNTINVQPPQQNEQPFAPNEAVTVGAKAFNHILAILNFYAAQGWDGGMKARTVLSTLNVIRTKPQNDNGDDSA